MEFILSQLQNVESGQVVALRNADLFLLIGYALVYFTTRKTVFIAVFFIDYITANSIILDSLTDFNYYIFPAFIYAMLYWHLVKERKSVKIQSACGIIILFYFMVALDAKLYGNTQTVLYVYYAAFALFVHVNFILTLIDWKILRSRMGSVISWILDSIRHSVTVTFFCYNVLKPTDKQKSQ